MLLDGRITGGFTSDQLADLYVKLGAIQADLCETILIRQIIVAGMSDCSENDEYDEGDDFSEKDEYDEGFAGEGRVP